MPITLTAASFVADSIALLGLGSSAALGPPFYNPMTSQIVNLAGGPFAFAFSMPDNAVLNSFAMFFTNSAGLTLTETLTVGAQIFSSPAPPTNTFNGLATTPIEVPITGIVAPGTAFFGRVTGLNLPVTAQTRLLVVFYVKTNAPSGVGTLTGYAGAGIGFM